MSDTYPKYQFPPAELPRWIQYLTQTSEAFANQPITRIVLPGTHDAATYGPGEFPTNVARFNWQCQNLNIYQQAKIGVRYFDLRFRAEDERSRYPYWPFHGEARKTGDLLAPPPGQPSDEDTITLQIRRFLDENPDEILLLSSLCEPAGNVHWIKAISDGLGGSHRLLPSPDKTNSAVSSGRPAIPTLKNVLQTTGRVIISGSVDVANIVDPGERELINRYLWRSPGEAFSPSLYDRQIWKSNDPMRVQSSMEQWIATNMAHQDSGQRFFNAQCQLTPAANSAGDVFRGFFKKSMTISPITLAPVMNAHVSKALCRSEYWIKHASVMTVDFADANICSAIAGMNLARLGNETTWCVHT